MSVLVLILVIPLGAIALSYRAHREAALLRGDVARLAEELAYWRETGGRLMAGLVRDQDPERPGGVAAAKAPMSDSMSAVKAVYDPVESTAKPD
jgi:hypothetical protein